jgi:hypothetical protein
VRPVSAGSALRLGPAHHSDGQPGGDTVIHRDLEDTAASPRRSPGSIAGTGRGIRSKPARDGRTSAFDAKLTSEDGAAQDFFGLSVALSARTVAVGAPAEIGLDRPGAVYLFVRPSDGWQGTSAFDAKLTAPEATGSDAFGFAVAISSRELAASALGLNVTRGAAYIFGGLPPACEPGRRCVTPVSSLRRSRSGRDSIAPSRSGQIHG